MAKGGREMTLRVLVELSPSLKADEWARLHTEGVVPDRVPYGLNRLADAGFSIVVREPPRSLTISLLSRVGAKLTGGARWPESVLGTPRASTADFRFFWEERMSIPALLLRTGRHRKQPIVTGVIWNTEHETANLSSFAWWLTKTAIRRADAVFVLSAAQAPVLSDWGVSASRVHFVPFGVDTDFWDPAASPVPDSSGTPALHEHPIIMSVGNDRHRDHGLLLEAMRKVHEKVPEARLELVTSRPHVIPPQIGLWRQSLTHLELRDLHRRSRLVAIATKPNIHASGVTAILESMAMGKAVVLTRTPGLEDYVEHGKTGIFVPPNDPDAMTRALVELVTDSDRCQRIGAAARESVLANFSTQVMCQRLAEVIRSVA